MLNLWVSCHGNWLCEANLLADFLQETLSFSPRSQRAGYLVSCLHSFSADQSSHGSKAHSLAEVYCQNENTCCINQGLSNVLLCKSIISLISIFFLPSCSNIAQCLVKDSLNEIFILHETLILLYITGTRWTQHDSLCYTFTEMLIACNVS